MYLNLAAPTTAMLWLGRTRGGPCSPAHTPIRILTLQETIITQQGVQGGEFLLRYVFTDFGFIRIGDHSN